MAAKNFKSQRGTPKSSNITKFTVMEAWLGKTLVHTLVVIDWNNESSEETERLSIIMVILIKQFYILVITKKNPPWSELTLILHNSFTCYSWKQYKIIKLQLRILAFKRKKTYNGKQKVKSVSTRIFSSFLCRSIFQVKIPSFVQINSN